MTKDEVFKIVVSRWPNLSFKRTNEIADFGMEMIRIGEIYADVEKVDGLTVEIKFEKKSND